MRPTFRMRVRAGLVTSIYAKALVLSNDERNRASGDIVNLMSVDATRLQDLCTFGLIVISGPLQVGLRVTLRDCPNPQPKCRSLLHSSLSIIYWVGRPSSALPS